MIEIRLQWQGHQKQTNFRYTRHTPLKSTQRSPLKICILLSMLLSLLSLSLRDGAGLSRDTTRPILIVRVKFWKVAR